ncbi:MAG TPA: glycoside hydrolase family 15 protein [Terriglobales bacterium]|nr:glycoside hydrolase family 15 protein [Terriglobales bacterium]
MPPDHSGATTRSHSKQAKIHDYGVIGDSRSAALVSKSGSVDWLCWPQFDSPPIFAAIIDPQQGGHWTITPEGPFESERSYVGDSNVLETRFRTSSGHAVLTDLMPVASEEYKWQNTVPSHELVRELRCVKGEMQFAVELVPRCDYGRKPARICDVRKMGLRFDAGRGSYWVQSNAPWKVGDGSATARVAMKQGDELQFSLTYSEESPAAFTALGEPIRASIRRSVEWWHEWAGRCSYDGPFREAVVRSALALKLLAYAPSGAIAAAATTSLPERIGAELNWDYRYCWLRDASLAIRSLLGLGYYDEAESFITWLLHATKLTQPELRVLYTMFGRIAPRENLLDYLRGYFGSRPVRVGNGARQQFQLDIYGEVIEATAQYAEHLESFDRTTQKALIGFGKYVAKNWDRADEGIWEPRSGRQHHTHSRLMCWTALDRLLAMDEKGKISGVPRELFTRERDRIREQIETRAWNAKLQSYVSTLDGEGVDATLLRIAWYGLEAGDSERMRGTYRKVCQELDAGGDLVYRYRRDPPEGAFGICGFWVVEQLVMAGELRQAHAMFERLLKYGNGLGLFAEEVDPETGDALGNFPQAFTHIGLISAALTLQEKERGESHPAAKVGADTASKGNS